MREIPPAVLELIKTHGEKFKEIFGVEINKFAGRLCFIGVPDFDIVEFNDFMRRKGYREDKDGSLADYIEKNYGAKGKELIDKLISM